MIRKKKEKEKKQNQSAQINQSLKNSLHNFVYQNLVEELTDFENPVTDTLSSKIAIKGLL